MQITQVPPLPVAPAATTQPQALANLLPAVAAQSVKPISDKAVAPTRRSDAGQKARSRADKPREGDAKEEDGRGGQVNLSV